MPLFGELIAEMRVCVRDRKRCVPVLSAISVAHPHLTAPYIDLIVTAEQVDPRSGMSGYVPVL